MRSFRARLRRLRKVEGDIAPAIVFLLVLVVVGLAVAILFLRKSKPAIPPPMRASTPSVGSGASTSPNQAVPGRADSTVTPVVPPAEGPAKPSAENRNKARKAAERARGLAQKGDFVEAVKAFEGAVALLAPEKDETILKELADAQAERDSRLLLLQASSAEKAGDIAAALQHAQGALQLKPKEETAALVARYKSILLTDEGRKKEAAGDMKGALACYEEAARLHASSELTDRIKELTEKIRVAEAAAAKAKCDDLVARAKAAEKGEDFFTAVQLYEEARQYAVNKEELETMLSAAGRQRDDYRTLFNMWLSRGNDHLRAGQWGEAIMAFERAQKYNRTDASLASLIREAREKAILQDMALVPAGEFLFGEDRTPKTLPAFYMDRYEVTNAQYKTFVDATGHQPPRGWARGAPPAEMENLPVTGVSWEDTIAYAAWAGKRLPSELEWEKAARGTDGRTYPWGADFDPSKCNAAESSAGKLAAVGTTAGDSSPYEIKDLAGNVAEWTATAAETAPQVDAKLAVLKGASFLLPGAQAGRTFARFADERDLRMVGYGFRCARDVE